MKNCTFIYSIFILFFSCKKEEQAPICRLTMFITIFPATKISHYDQISLKDNRIERIYSYDLNVNKDTSGRIKTIFEYNSLGKISAFRDESNINKITRYDLVYNEVGLPIKSVQTTNGTLTDEVILEYDAQKRPIGATGVRLLGVNRSIEYDADGNPFRIIRADFGNLPTVYEHTFDINRNFFAGIPEIQTYWLLRPLYIFLPFGDNNVLTSKYFTLKGTDFKEVPELRTTRETVVNAQGFPTSMKIILENQSNQLSSESKFEYNCQ